ncbi:MAG: ATP-dependent DNA ligase [Candidatus Dormibacteraeota bacterium]|nr:ATP-dependent DNA ligase [Candidatus Dormibacteraeota bacterium]
MLQFARTAEQIGATGSTLEKARVLAEYLITLASDDLSRAVLWMSGQPYGRSQRYRLNLGWKAIAQAVGDLSALSSEELSSLYLKHSDLGDWGQEALAGRTGHEQVSLGEVAAGFDAIRLAKSAAQKQRCLQALLARLEPLQAKYVLKILSLELRIGVQEGLVEAALARAFDVPLAAVQRTHMLTGDLGVTALRCRAGGLATGELQLFQPVRFMLASPVESAAEAFARMRTPVLWTEEKYDGVRCQLHLSREGRCELFSRDLKETTAAFPEVVEAAVGVGHELLIDGEILAHRGDRVLPFSDLQRRLGRKLVSRKLRLEAPVVLVAFDLLWLDGKPLLDLPLIERRRRLQTLGLGWPFLLARLEDAADPQHLEQIFAETRERGNEGLMLKDPQSPYTPGRRGLAWLKLKRPLASLDVVVTAVEWGHGKRRNVLSDYTFAVRAENGRLLNVGKAYTGLTDREIETMTKHFLAHTISQHGRTLAVQPEVVLEVTFDALQRSNRHRSGYAMRFPRIVRLRPDKPASEIDTLGRVEELYSRYFGREVPLAEVATGSGLAEAEAEAARGEMGGEGR